MISLPNRRMNNQRLDQLIRRIATEVDGELGYWRFDLGGRQLMVVTDESHNRMRVMSAIIGDDGLSDRDLSTMLAANFDRALDAKYAIAQGYIWSVFTHPLSELADDQFLDAVQQVKTLAENYGTTYCSSDLVFGGG